MQLEEVACNSRSPRDALEAFARSFAVMYAKLRPYEGGINGWSQCNCLKQGIRPRLMTDGIIYIALVAWARCH